MNRRHHAAALLLAMLSVASPAHAEIKRFGVTGFDRVEVYGDMLVEIVPDHRVSAVAEASPDALDTLSLQVQDRTLVIREVIEGAYGMRRSQGAPIRIRLSAQNLAGVLLRGSGRIAVQGLRGDAILVVLDGAGRIEATVAGGRTVRSRVTGTGTATIAGRATSLESVVSGAAQVDASGLLARDVVVRANGSGTSRYAASGTARVIASGDASIDVAGRARCTVANSGSGQVNCGNSRQALSR